MLLSEFINVLHHNEDIRVFIKDVDGFKSMGILPSDGDLIKCYFEREIMWVDYSVLNNTCIVINVVLEHTADDEED